MSTILAQLRNLRKQIHIPYAMKIVNAIVEDKDFEEKVIYVHIWI